MSLREDLTKKIVVFSSAIKEYRRLFIGKPESSGGLGGRLENNIRFKKDHEKNNYGYSFLKRHVGLNENFVFKINRNIIDKVSNLKIADIGCGFGFNIIKITQLLNIIKPDSYDFKIEF